MTEKAGLKANKLKSFKKADPIIADTFNLDFGKVDISSIDLDIQSLAGSKKLFLGRFSEQDMNNMIESIGLLKHLESIGFSAIHIDIDRDENYINYFRLYWKDKTPENQLLDLRVSEHTFIPHERFFEKDFKIDPYNMILIEWLSAKNPLTVFDKNRPQLPGQSSPGLGILKYCFQLLYNISREVYKDGFLDIPSHMHGAIMYSKEFKFFDPLQEATLRAAVRDLKNYSIADISWGVITETIIDLHKDAPAVYDPGEQVHYVSNGMKKYFESKKYVATFKRCYKKKKYFFNYEEMVRKREAILLTSKIEDL
ncbi:MAG: hypothetical protein U9N81_12995 [Bacillota bacterium]|nr:hypothetical protein [Bacillota bacterium]